MPYIGNTRYVMHAVYSEFIKFKKNAKMCTDSEKSYLIHYILHAFKEFSKLFTLITGMP
jgi:hypothetical protein